MAKSKDELKKGDLEGNIFMCNIRINGANRCFPGVSDIALLQIQKMHYLTLLEQHFL